MKAVAFSELLLLLAILAVAWFVYVQQEQLVALELEVDRLRGSFDAPPFLPMEGNSANSEASLQVPKPKPKPKRQPPKPKAAGA